jgi:hypothetical protein
MSDVTKDELTKAVMSCLDCFKESVSTQPMDDLFALLSQMDFDGVTEFRMDCLANNDVFGLLVSDKYLDRLRAAYYEDGSDD